MPGERKRYKKTLHLCRKCFMNTWKLIYELVASQILQNFEAPLRCLNFHDYFRSLVPKFIKIQLFFSSRLSMTTLMYINKNWVDISFQFQNPPISRLVPTKLQQLPQFDSLTDSSIMKSLLSWQLSSLVPARFLLLLGLMLTPMGNGTCKIMKMRTNTQPNINQTDSPQIHMKL